MAKVIIGPTLFEEIQRKFKGEAHSIIDLLETLQTNPHKGKELGNAGGIVATAIAGLYSTAACGACLSALFAFAGTGTTVFMSQHRDVFVAISALITFYAIYLSAKSINGHCESCKVTKK